MISWRNPDERHAEWGLDTYGQAIIDAMDAVERATGQREGRRSRRSAPAGSSPRCCWPTWPTTGEQDRVTAAQLRRHRPRLVARRHRLRADGRGVGQGRDREVAEEGLPGRRPAGRGLRLAAAQRPGVELLGQQLPAGQAAAELRHPLLERRHHADDRGPAPRLHRHRDRQRADRAGEGDDARARRSTCPRSPSTPTSRPGSPTTSARGRPATAPPSCWAGRAGSSCPPAGTSPRWSTRRATRSRRSRSRAGRRPTRRSGWRRRRRSRAPGGRTT